MSRHSDTSVINWVPAGTSIVGGYTSPAVNLLGAEGLSITLINAGTVSGTFKLQITDFGASELYPQDLPASNSWVDSGVTLTGAAGAQVIQIASTNAAINAKWVRLVFTDSASSGATTNASVTVRRFPG